MLKTFSAVAAAAWVVGATAGDIINVPADHPTIQAAINAANDGDEVVVAQGVYLELINFLGKAIIVRSSAGAGTTIINGNGAGIVVTCQTGEGPDTVLQGFTIVGGRSAGYGGGMFCGYASPTIMDCVFRMNEAAVGNGMGLLRPCTETTRRSR